MTYAENSGPRPRPGVLDIPAYIPGSHATDSAEPPVILSANENPLGASPDAIAACRADGTPHRYPDGDAAALRQAIGEVHDMDPARIVCGAGSDELITLLCRAYAGPGDEVLYSAHGFLMYGITARAVGATPVAAPEQDLCADVDALLAHVNPATRLLFLANPNNPTGSYLNREAINRLQAGLPGHVLLVIDAAYSEYVDRVDYTDGREFVDSCANVVMLRTFSKIHGLAALRLGWAYAPAPTVAVINRLRSPFNVSAMAQTAGIAAMRDRQWVARSREHNATQRARLSSGLQQLGLATPASEGNFLLAGFGDKARASGAETFLRARGVLPRAIGAYGLPDYLRITVGTEQEVGRCLDVLRLFVDSGA